MESMFNQCVHIEHNVNNTVPCISMYFPTFNWLVFTAAGTNPFSFKNFVAARSANDNDTSDVVKVMS